MTRWAGAVLVAGFVAFGSIALDAQHAQRPQQAQQATPPPCRHDAHSLFCGANTGHTPLTDFFVSQLPPLPAPPPGSMRSHRVGGHQMIGMTNWTPAPHGGREAHGFRALLERFFLQGIEPFADRQPDCPVIVTAHHGVQANVPFRLLAACRAK